MTAGTTYLIVVKLLLHGTDPVVKCAMQDLVLDGLKLDAPPKEVSLIHIHLYSCGIIV